VHHDRDRLWQHTSQPIDLLAMGREVAQIDHPADREEYETIYPLEPLPDLWQLGEEVGVVLLLSRCTPAHVDVLNVMKVEIR